MRKQISSQLALPLDGSSEVFQSSSCVSGDKSQPVQNHLQSEDYVQIFALIVYQLSRMDVRFRDNWLCTSPGNQILQAMVLRPCSRLWKMAQNLLNLNIFIAFDY